MAGVATSALDMVAQTVRDIDAGSAAEDAVLRHLGREWRLSTAAVVHASPDLPVRTVAVWPDQESASALAALLHERSMHLARTLVDTWEVATWRPEAQHDARHVLYAVIRPSASRAAQRSPTWVAAFARAAPFSHDDLRLWTAVREPLTVLWGLAERVNRPGRQSQAPGRPAGVAPEPMSPRELQVLELLAHGRLATSIATELAVSPRTVHRHLANIYRKLGVHDRMVAVNLAREQGLLGDTAS